MLLLCAVAIPMLLACTYGSVESPAADDWSYDLATFHLALHGVVNLNHWGTVNALGQVALAAPFVWIFGPHVAVLNVWTCVVGFGGLLSTDYLLRRAGAGRWAALAVVAAMSAGPMYSALAVSFMTDIPSYALMMTALAVAASDQSRGRMFTRRSVLALVLGVVAFTIREPAGIAFVAVAAGRVWQCRERSRADWRRWGGAVVLLGLVAAAFYIWRRGLPSTGYEAPPHLELGRLTDWYAQEWLLPLLGLMLLVPALVCRPVETVREAWRRHRGALWSLWLVLVVGPWVIRYAAYVHDRAWRYFPPHQLLPSLGNWYFSNNGDAAHLAPIVPAWGLAGLAVLSSLVWVAVSGHLVLAWSRWRSERDVRTVDGRAVQAAFLAAVAAGGSVLLLGLIIVTGEQMWDRYLFPVAGTLSVVMAFGAKVAQKRDEPAMAGGTLRRVAGAALGAAAFLGIASANLAYTVAMDAWDGSEWAYSTAFAHRVPGVAPKYIFTNWLWNSVQAGIDEEPNYHLDPSYRPCWSELATNSPTDWAPLRSSKPEFVRTYRTWVVTYRYEMMPYDPAAPGPMCHLAPSG